MGTIRSPLSSRLSRTDGPQPEDSAKGRLVRRLAAALARVLRWRDPGWFLLVELRKAAAPDAA